MFRKILQQEVGGLSIAHWENLTHHLFLLKVLLNTPEPFHLHVVHSCIQNKDRKNWLIASGMLPASFKLLIYYPFTEKVCVDHCYW